MKEIPGSPLPMYVGFDQGKRSWSLAVACSDPKCRSGVGTHCVAYRWGLNGYDHGLVPEFHQERIDRSKLCQCGKPSTVVCTKFLNDEGDPCWSRICDDCAKPSKQGGYRCRYHQQNGDCDE